MPCPPWANGTGTLDAGPPGLGEDKCKLMVPDAGLLPQQDGAKQDGPE